MIRAEGLLQLSCAYFVLFSLVDIDIKFKEIGYLGVYPCVHWFMMREDKWPLIDTYFAQKLELRS